MRKQEREPFLPFITVDDIMKFDPEREETHTESRFVNAVLRAIYRVGAGNTKRITSYLALEDHILNHGIRIACGMSLTGLRSIVTIKTAARMRAENPKSRLEDVAIRLGYSDRASVWRILNNKKYAEVVQRLCPDLIQQRQQNSTDKEELMRILFGDN